MWSLGYVVLFVGATTLPLWRTHWDRYHTVNLSQASLALFHSINAMICLWEISLFVHRKLIKAHYTAMKRQLPTGTLPSPMFLFEDVKLSQAFTFQHWSKVWSTYSLIDPSYSEQTSFGWNIDVGNGFVTLIPTVLFSLGLTYDLMQARVLGIMGLILNYQMFYGTVIYFFSYFINERWKGRPGLPIVLGSNGIWLIGPAFAMYISIQLIMTDSYAVLRT